MNKDKLTHELAAALKAFNEDNPRPENIDFLTSTIEHARPVPRFTNKELCRLFEDSLGEATDRFIESEYMRYPAAIAYARTYRALVDEVVNGNILRTFSICPIAAPADLVTLLVWDHTVIGITEANDVMVKADLSSILPVGTPISHFRVLLVTDNEIIVSNLYIDLAKPEPTKCSLRIRSVVSYRSDGDQLNARNEAFGNAAAALAAPLWRNVTGSVKEQPAPEPTDVIAKKFVALSAADVRRQSLTRDMAAMLHRSIKSHLRTYLRGSVTGTNGTTAGFLQYLKDRHIQELLADYESVHDAVKCYSIEYVGGVVNVVFRFFPDELLAMTIAIPEVTRILAVRVYGFMHEAEAIVIGDHKPGIVYTDKSAADFIITDAPVQADQPVDAIKPYRAYWLTSLH